MSVVAKIESEGAALKLIRVGLRLNYVGATTGIHKVRWLRTVWREVHKRRAVTGRSSEGCDTGLKTQAQRREAAAWVDLYLGVCETETKSIEVNRFSTSWKLFRVLYPNAYLQIDPAWVILRNYFSREIAAGTCNKCGEFFVHEHRVGKCPFCSP